MRNLLLLAAGLTGPVVMFAQSAPSIGERAAKQAYSLIALAEMSNYARRDPRCVGTPFSPYSSAGMVEDYVEPMLLALAKAERRQLADQDRQILTLLHDLPNQDSFKRQVVEKAFDQKYQEAVAGYGKSGACAALASGINVGIHQLQTWLRDSARTLSSPPAR